MVQNEEIIVAKESTVNSMPLSPPAQGVPDGQYRLVGWGIDTTGLRLIDEICQIVAYTPTSQFSQYIMPFSDINLSYRRRHSLRVINLGRLRMLKDVKTNKFVKTKSEISALTDFLIWLEENHGDATDGIILIYHEARKTTPGMLLEALRRYNLIERFSKVVKGFANGYSIAEVNCAKSTKSYSLRVMAKMLLNKDEECINAKDRAQACYEVVVHLGQGERPDLETVGSGDCSGAEKHLTDFVRPFTNPISAEEDEIAGFKVLLERQNSFKPVFGALLKATWSERRHASHLRRLLAENNLDYGKIKETYENSAKQGLEEVLKKEVATAKEKDLSELLEILDCFFDPDKVAIRPKPRFYSNPNKRFRGKRQPNKLNKDKDVNENASSLSSGVTSVNPSSDSTPRSDENTAQ